MFNRYMRGSICNIYVYVKSMFRSYTFCKRKFNSVVRKRFYKNYVTTLHNLYNISGVGCESAVDIYCRLHYRY